MPKPVKVQADALVFTAKNKKLMLGRKLLGELVPERKRRNGEDPRTVFAFYPSATGERLGLVRAFAGPKGIIDYVSNYLLREQKITDAQWKASRRNVH